MGRKLSDEHKAKIGAKHRGKHVSDETRAKMSASHKSSERSRLHIATVHAARANMVLVSRNDAAMLEVVRPFTLRWNEAVAHRNDKSSSKTPIIRAFEAEDRQKTASMEFIALSGAWLDGQDVMLAKLAQE